MHEEPSMNKLITTTILLASIAITASSNGENVSTNNDNKASGYERVGGRVTKPNSSKGTIGIVNCQKSVPSNEFKKTVEIIQSVAPYNISIVESQISSLPSKEIVEKLGFSIAVFITEDNFPQTLLAAPDDRWAMLNVKMLKEGLDENDRERLNRRARGQLMRAFALVCGAGTSQYPGNIHDATCVNDLDSLNPDQMIHDVVQRCRKNLTAIGVKEPYTVVYKKAVAEGWAPSPTNDVQRAIWEKIKAEQSEKPSNPIRILPGQKPSGK